MKDVPDVKGDQVSNIRTFSVRLGPARVFGAMRYLLAGLFYGVGGVFGRRAVVLAVSGGSSSARVTAARVLTAAVALAFGWSVQKESRNVDPTDSKQVYQFYMHLWKLFYGSYLVLPFAM